MSAKTHPQGSYRWAALMRAPNGQVLLGHYWYRTRKQALALIPAEGWKVCGFARND